MIDSLAESEIPKSQDNSILPAMVGAKTKIEFVLAHGDLPEITVIGTDNIDIYPQVQRSWAHVSQLSPERQSQITYLKKYGQCFIIIGGIQFHLQSEHIGLPGFWSEMPGKFFHLPDGVGPIDTRQTVFTDYLDSSTYFNNFAAQEYAKTRRLSLPSYTDILKMGEIVGGVNLLINILQLPNCYVNRAPVMGRNDRYPNYIQSGALGSFYGSIWLAEADSYLDYTDDKVLGKRSDQKAHIYRHLRLVEK